MSLKALDDVATALTIAGAALFAAGVKIYAEMHRLKDAERTDGPGQVSD
jgi:hypothetical protein